MCGTHNVRTTMAQHSRNHRHHVQEQVESAAVKAETGSSFSAAAVKRSAP